MASTADWNGTERRQKQPRHKDNCLQENIFLRSVIDGMSDPILVMGTDFRVKLFNRAAFAFFHPACIAREQAHCYQLLHGLNEPCNRHGRPCPLIEVLESGNPVTVEHEHLAMDGRRVRTCEVQASPLQDEDGNLMGIIEVFRDVTGRKELTDLLQKGCQELEERVAARTMELEMINVTLRKEIEDRLWAEDEFLQAKEQAELIYRLIPSATFSVDLKQRITSWNNKAEEVTGYQRAEVLGQPCYKFALKPCTGGCRLFSSKVKKPIMGRECEIRGKDGRIRIISKNADLLRNKHGEVIGGIESFEDITARKDTENVLRTERDKFQSMLSALGQGMYILNHDYRIEYQNEVLSSLFGDNTGRKCYEAFRQSKKPCDICRMQEAIATNEIQRTELLMSDSRYYEQSYAPFVDMDGRTKVLILLRNITEEKAFQAETMRAGKLASIGELAAGVAHEINNPINGIINYAQLIWDQEASTREDREILAKIIAEGERIAEIVRNLLFFARQQDDEREIVHLDAVLEDALSLFRNQLMKDGIILTVQVPPGLPPIKANYRHLQQIYLNLLSNARYALNQRYPGRDPDKKLEIKGETIRFEGRELVRLAFTDQGIGIPPEILGCIFDPFFSTKKPGEGTGLGLSISHGLVKDLNGYLRVRSEPNRYTTMMVDLPAHESAAEGA